MVSNGFAEIRQNEVDSKFGEVSAAGDVPLAPLGDQLVSRPVPLEFHPLGTPTSHPGVTIDVIEQLPSPADRGSEFKIESALSREAQRPILLPKNQIHPEPPAESTVEPIAIAAISFVSGTVFCAVLCTLFLLAPVRSTIQRQAESQFQARGTTSPSDTRAETPSVTKYNDVDESDTCQIAQRNEAARLIVAHAVSLMQPEPGSPIYGVIGAPSRASITNKQAIVAATRSAFDAVAIVPEPFAVALSMGDIDEALVVDIGAGTIDICPVFGMYPRE
ncbi:MAG: hypothetical protein ACC628_20560, partial [Pirellulaceae bacterium]